MGVQDGGGSITKDELAALMAVRVQGGRGGALDSRSPFLDSCSVCLLCDVGCGRLRRRWASQPVW